MGPITNIIDTPNLPSDTPYINFDLIHTLAPGCSHFP